MTVPAAGTLGVGEHFPLRSMHRALARTEIAGKPPHRPVSSLLKRTQHRRQTFRRGQRRRCWDTAHFRFRLVDEGENT